MHKPGLSCDDVMRFTHDIGNLQLKNRAHLIAIRGGASAMKLKSKSIATKLLLASSLSAVVIVVAIVSFIKF